MFSLRYKLFEQGIFLKFVHTKNKVPLQRDVLKEHEYTYTNTNEHIQEHKYIFIYSCIYISEHVYIYIYINSYISIYIFI